MGVFPRFLLGILPSRNSKLCKSAVVSFLAADRTMAFLFSGWILSTISVEVRLLGKKQPLKMDVKWVPPDDAEHARCLRETMAAFLARLLDPDLYKILDESQEVMREADRILTSSMEFLHSQDKKSQQDADVQQRIAELEAEVAKLRGKLGRQD